MTESAINVYSKAFLSSLERIGFPVDKDKDGKIIYSSDGIPKSGLGAFDSQKKMESIVTDRFAKVHSRTLGNYSKKDLVNAIEFLEAFVLFEATKGNVVDLADADAEFSSKFKEIPREAEKLGKAIKVLEDLYEIAKEPKKIRKARYGNQGEVAIRRANKLFNDIPTTDKLAYKSKFTTAIKTIEAFHKKWKA